MRGVDIDPHRHDASTWCHGWSDGCVRIQSSWNCNVGIPRNQQVHYAPNHEHGRVRICKCLLMFRIYCTFQRVQDHNGITTTTLGHLGQLQYHSETWKTSLGFIADWIMLALFGCRIWGRNALHCRGSPGRDGYRGSVLVFLLHHWVSIARITLAHVGDCGCLSPTR